LAERSEPVTRPHEDARNPREIPGPQEFSGRVAVVTGAGGGLGAGIARRFAAAGASVVVNYRRSEVGAARVVHDIESGGGRAIAVRSDVTVAGEVERLLEETVDHFGRVDAFINNAGAYPLSTLLDMSVEEWEAVMAANLRSVFLCTQAAARRMKNGDEGGSIVNIASIEGESPMPLHSHYNAAKAGVIMHTRTAANELGPLGIRVNAVSPGLIWREGIEEAWPEGVARWKAACPLGRLGRPEDVADACIFLCSPAARWITGVNLRVDGGVLTGPAF